ncbi:c-type cytochrome [Halarcobacter anaerophilus]|uniref:Cytochrome C n=1 Tax=Halarcobacter anaerophilus TaxID=877500 RepID=A0A4Q0XW40_9BACT|nr:c-type cytochrome [Halarcobacter anaerophilus]QDF28227.1 periplasmic monoheme cytochrome c553 [Halarcobacter anaerophilus]RXJ61383.1 cytochrome C [Halarcobacter anaerophilus]
MKKVVLGTLLAAASLMAANYATCATCHGATAEKAALGKSQIIKGWPVEKTVAALKGYKDGSYGGAMKGVMKGQVARLSDADIEDLAKQIAAFK